MSALRRLRIGRADSDQHQAFFEYLPRVFPGADFRLWNARRGWTDSYHAHALADGEMIVANVSVSSMDVRLQGVPVRGAQLGAVGVVPEWRGRGLQRELMAELLPGLLDDYDLVFLFANAEVLDFYPRFGMKRVPEFVFGVEQELLPGAERCPRLDLDDAHDLELFRSLSVSSLPPTERFGPCGYGGVLLWHATYCHPRSLHFLPEQEAIVIAEQQGESLRVRDVLAARLFDLIPALSSMIDSPVRRIEFGFTPEKWCAPATVLREHTDSYLFVRTELSLPALPFKFPVLAEA